jgi:hypothetical protein
MTFDVHESNNFLDKDTRRYIESLGFRPLPEEKETYQQARALLEQVHRKYLDYHLCNFEIGLCLMEKKDSSPFTSQKRRSKKALDEKLHEFQQLPLPSSIYTAVCAYANGKTPGQEIFQLFTPGMLRYMFQVHQKMPMQRDQTTKYIMELLDSTLNETG